MSKKLIITEEEKKDIKSLYNINEQISFDSIIEYLGELLKNMGKKVPNANSDVVTTKMTPDDEFYKEVLSCVGAKPTTGNMSFMYAWRQAEGGTASNNPFNTTMKMPGATLYKNSSAGVKNYKSEEEGIEATCKTLKLSYYTDIVNGLKNDVGLKELSRMRSLKTWGTGDLLAKVADGYLKGSSPKPPYIA